MALIQILPVSFAQNLFYIAVLQHPSTQPELLVSRKGVIGLTGAYIACLIIAPITAGTVWVIPNILFARAILVIVQIFPWKKADGEDKVARRMDDGSALNGKEVHRHLILLMTLCGFAQASLAFLETSSPGDVGKALFEDPAVSALGCDFLISIISYACWRQINNANSSNQQKAARRTND